MWYFPLSLVNPRSYPEMTLLDPAYQFPININRARISLQHSAPESNKLIDKAQTIIPEIIRHTCLLCCQD